MTVQEQVDLLDIGELEPVNTVVRRRLGKPVSHPTIWRWVRMGVRNGIKLDALFACGLWQTTDAAFADFLERQTADRMAHDDESQESSDA